MKILNIYELNIFQVLTFIYRCKLNLSPKIFNSFYTFKPPNKYTLRSKLLIEPVHLTYVDRQVALLTSHDFSAGPCPPSFVLNSVLLSIPVSSSKLSMKHLCLLPLLAIRS